MADKKDIVNGIIGPELIEKLGPQIDVLQRLQDNLVSIEDQLFALYADKYPKKCNLCGSIYNNRDEYLAATEQLSTDESPTGSMMDEGKVLEFRNCPCGSTLAIFTGDRRDESEYGQKRREIFEECVENMLKSDEALDRDEVVEIVRAVFRHFINQNMVKKKAG